MEVCDSKIKTVRRMVQENLDCIEAVREIIEQYQDKILRVDFSIVSYSIDIVEKNFCIIPEIEAQLCKLGIKFERSERYEYSYSDKPDIGKVYYIKISPMRYLKWGELE